MQRVVAVVILVVLVLNCAPTLPQVDYSLVTREQQIVMSERVGDVIDAEEREQFGLFPTVEGFQEARFYRFGEGGYALEIASAEEKLMSVNNWSSAVLLMKDYIDNYEEYEGSPKSFAVKWQIVGYDDLGVPITKYEVDRISIKRAVSCGCIGGIVAGLGALAFVIAEAGDNDTSGGDMSVGIGIMVGAVILPVLAGGLAGCVTGFGVYINGKRRAVQTIREMRKPRIIETDLEGN